MNGRSTAPARAPRRPRALLSLGLLLGISALVGPARGQSVTGSGAWSQDVPAQPGEVIVSVAAFGEDASTGAATGTITLTFPRVGRSTYDVVFMVALEDNLVFIIGEPRPPGSTLYNPPIALFIEDRGNPVDERTTDRAFVISLEFLSVIDWPGWPNLEDLFRLFAVPILQGNYVIRDGGTR